jgi:hypothetical protein
LQLLLRAMFRRGWLLLLCLCSWRQWLFLLGLGLFGGWLHSWRLVAFRGPARPARACRKQLVLVIDFIPQMPK